MEVFVDAVEESGGKGVACSSGSLAETLGEFERSLSEVFSALRRADGSVLSVNGDGFLNAEFYEILSRFQKNGCVVCVE